MDNTQVLNINDSPDFNELALEVKQEFLDKDFPILYNDDWKNIKTADIIDINFGRFIAHKLFITLEKYKTAKMLSANQIGLPFNVAVLNVREPLYFINPIILDETKLIDYLESDNSYPQKICATKHFGRVLISAMNFKSPIWFGVKIDQIGLLDNQYATTHPIIEECIAAQHAIDTLNGISMFERNCEFTYKREKSPNRNQIIKIQKDNEIKSIKYKFSTRYLNDGWKII